MRLLKRPHIEKCEWKGNYKIAVEMNDSETSSLGQKCHVKGSAVVVMSFVPL